MTTVERQNQEATVLVVDDNPTSLGVIVVYLEKHGFDVRAARDGETGLKRAGQIKPDLILLDVMLPGLNGFEVCRRLKAYEATREIPIIFMTALASTDDKIKGFEVGGVDYITKPIQHAELLARVTTHLRIQSLSRRLREKNEHLQRMMDILFKRTMQLETSSQVGQQVTLIVDLDELLHKVVGVIQLNFEYYFIGIWLLDEEQQKVILQARAGDLVDLPEPDFQLSMTQVECAVVWVCQRSQAWLVENVSAPARYLNIMDAPANLSELVLPLQAGQKMIGALEVLSGPGAFENEDQMVLQGVADQIAIAIRNVQLYQAEQRRRLEISRLNEQLEEKVAERTSELSKAYRDLEQIEKTKNHFIQITSHELRTPLALVKGYAQILKSLPEGYNIANADEYLSGMLNGVERLDHIANTMFDVARVDSQVLDIRQDPTRLLDVIEYVGRRFKGALQERRLHLILKDLENLPTTPANPDLLIKVFHNIIINAIKYTPDGGTITVSGQEIERAGGTNFIEIVVSDTGIGINPEHHEPIFEKFYQTGELDLHSSGQTKFKGGGPGLGLAIVKGIILAHHGQVWVESEGYDEQSCPGSHFHVLLPTNQDAESKLTPEL